MSIAIPKPLKLEHDELHEDLVRATRESVLVKLIDAAKRENKPESARFAQQLMLHAQTEEEVLYPATLVLGEVLRQRGVKV